MSEPTPEVARAFVAHMAQTFSAVISPKKNAIEMLAVASALSRMGVLDRQDFLANYATTLGRRVYLPFTPGEASGVWNLWAQMVTFTHECQHVVQYDRLGALRFGRDYLASSSGRAKLEAEAYRTNLELHHWRFGVVSDAHLLASGLRSYGCNDADIAFADQYLRLSGASVAAGAVINRSTRTALEWLEANAPELERF